MKQYFRPVYVIAEAGVNHNGSVELAEALVAKAAAAGADAVKFQTFNSEAVVSAHAPKAEYQIKTTGEYESQLEMVKKLELPKEAYKRIRSICKKEKIEFLSTPFDVQSLLFLTDECNVPIIKIPSGEINNAPFLLEIAHTGKAVILSTGMSTLGEVETALGILAYGYLNEGRPSSIEACANVIATKEGYAILKEKVSLLHCTTAYPAPYDEINLRCMDTLHAAFGLPVGYSDHTQGIAISLAAVARGAVIIEKHFTLDKNMEGPDHRASLEPNELKELIKGIRQIESALGSGRKIPTVNESKNIKIARKSLVAKEIILNGDLFTKENVAIKRPGDGLSPLLYWDVLGKHATRRYDKDEQL